MPFCRMCYLDVAVVAVWLVHEYSIIEEIVVGNLSLAILPLKRLFSILVIIDDYSIFTTPFPDE